MRCTVYCVSLRNHRNCFSTIDVLFSRVYFMQLSRVWNHCVKDANPDFRVRKPFWWVRVALSALDTWINPDLHVNKQSHAKKYHLYIKCCHVEFSKYKMNWTWHDLLSFTSWYPRDAAGGNSLASIPGISCDGANTDAKTWHRKQSDWFPNCEYTLL